MGLGSITNPRGNYKTSGTFALSTSYQLALDLDVADDDNTARFECHAVRVHNHDATIAIFVSFAGQTADTGVRVGPNSSREWLFFRPPKNKVYVKAASGTPNCDVEAWS